MCSKVAKDGAEIRIAKGGNDPDTEYNPELYGKYWCRRWVRPCQSLRSKATSGGRTISPKVVPPVLRTGGPMKAVKARTGSKCCRANNHYDHRHPVYEARVRTDTDRISRKSFTKGLQPKAGISERGEKKRALRPY